MGVLQSIATLLGYPKTPGPVYDAALNLTTRPVRSRTAGRVGTQVNNGYLFDEEVNSSLSSSLWYGSPGKPGIAQHMMVDPHVRQAVNLIVDPLCSAKWCFEPASSSALDREVADYCNWVFMERLPWTRILRRIGRGYVSNGFHLEEITDDIIDIPRDRFPQHKGGSRGVAITGFYDRPAWTINRFFQRKSDPTQLSAYEQYVVGSDAEPAGFTRVSAKRTLRFTYDQDGGDFTGVSVLRPTYQPWKLKTAFLTIDAIKHERTGVQTPVITLPEGSQDEDKAADILAEMRAQEKGFMVLPSGYVFEWTGGSEDDTSNLEAAIARCNVDIAVSVSAGFMLLGLSGSHGSFALGEAQRGPYHLTIDSHARFVEYVFNIGFDGWSPVERLVRQNYGEKVGIPRLKACNLPTRDWIKVSETVFKGILAGAITADDKLEAELRRSMELGPLDLDTARGRPLMFEDSGNKPREPEEAEPQEESMEEEDVE